MQKCINRKTLQNRIRNYHKSLCQLDRIVKKIGERIHQQNFRQKIQNLIKNLLIVKIN